MFVQHSTADNYWQNQQVKAYTNLQKSIEKLSSGLEVNRAADDAAGLAVSEKMRGILAGLNQGINNIDDGINYVRSVDGASQHIHNIINRLTTLADQGANGTYVDLDRDALDLEYQQLLEEIDQMTDTCNFNELNLFEEHMEMYRMASGNVVHNTPIIINSSNDTLNVGYTFGSTAYSCTVKLKHGTYIHPEEVADMIDDRLYDRCRDVIIDFDENNKFTMQVENGKLDYISGSAQELFFKTKQGFKGGYLLGVTEFAQDTSHIFIETGKNDVMKFRLGTDDTLYEITLDRGNYPYMTSNGEQGIIDEINEKLAAAGLDGTEGGRVHAVATLNSEGKKVIALESEDAVTGLSGNFLIMDEYSSPIYDICRVSADVNRNAKLSGARILDDEINVVRGRNEYFWLNVSDVTNGTKKVKVSLLDDGDNAKTYTKGELAARITEQLHDQGVAATAELYTSGGGEKLRIYTDQYGSECDIRLDTTDVPSNWMVYDYFTQPTSSVLSPNPPQSSFTAAYCQAYKELSDDPNKKTNIVTSGTNQNNTLRYVVTLKNGSTKNLDFALTAGAKTRGDIINELNNKLGAQLTNAGLSSDCMEFVSSSNAIRLQVKTGTTISNDAIRIDKITVSTAAANSKGYKDLIGGVNYYDNARSARGKTYDATSSTGTDGTPAVIRENGTTTPGVVYSNNTTGTKSSSKSYLNYTNVIPTTVNGSTDAGYESIVDDTKRHPASFTIAGAGTQFSALGTSIQDATLNFTLADKTGTVNKTVTIAAGSTKNQAAQAIQNALGNRGTVTFDGDDLIVTSTDTGTGVKFSDIGGTMCRRAEVDTSMPRIPGTNLIGTAATLKIPSSALNSQFPLTVTGDTNEFSLIVAGTRRSVYFDAGTTFNSAQDVVNALNSKFNSSWGLSAEVGSDGSVVISGALGTNDQSIILDGSSTCKLGYTKKAAVPGDPGYDPATGTVKTPGTLTLTQVGSHLKPSITFSAANNNNTLTINYRNPGDTSDRTLTINNLTGTYTTGQALANYLQNRIGSSGPVKVTWDANKGLVFTTTQSGAGAAVTGIGGTTGLDKRKIKPSDYGDTAKTNSSGKIVTPSTLVNDKFGTLCSSSNPLVITNNVNNKFKLVLTNGTTTKSDEISIAAGTYTNAQTFANAVRTALSGNNTFKNLVEASYDNTSGTITFKTKDANYMGSDWLLTYEAASYDAPVFKGSTSTPNPYSQQQIDSRCRLISEQSYSATQKIKIEDYNNTMSFRFRDTSVPEDITVNITAAAGEYTVNEFITMLQQQINDQIGYADGGTTPKLKVSNDSGRIKIEGNVTSNFMNLSEFKGIMYDNVFRKAPTRGTAATSTRGTSNNDRLSYIIGRNTLQPESEAEIEAGKVIIYDGVNNGVTLDFTYNATNDPAQATTTSVSFNIRPGTYTSEELADAVQTAGRAAFMQLQDENGNYFPEDFFNASIGLADLGVAENHTGIRSSDKLVLWCRIPKDGTHENVSVTLDGIRGSSAYRIFYDATKSPSPSTITGAADLSHSIYLGPEDGEMTFDFDGRSYRLSFFPGSYDIDRLVDSINNQLAAQGAKAKCGNNDGHLMFYSTENGSYRFDNFKGSAAAAIFYGTWGRNSDTEIGIQTGRRTGSYIWYQKTRVDTHLMHINTTGVTTAERASKALERLLGANQYLSKWRALSGANENRSEHTKSRNQIYIENLTAAESGIRDTEMATATAKFVKNKLLMDTQQVLAGKIFENQKSILNVIA